MARNLSPTCVYSNPSQIPDDQFLSGLTFDLDISTRNNRASNFYYPTNYSTFGPPYDATYGDIVPDGSNYVSFSSCLGTSFGTKYQGQIKFLRTATNTGVTWAWGTGTSSSNSTSGMVLAATAVGGYSNTIFYINFTTPWHVFFIVLAMQGSATYPLSALTGVVQTISWEYNALEFPNIVMYHNGNQLTTLSQAQYLALTDPLQIVVRNVIPSYIPYYPNTSLNIMRGGSYGTVFQTSPINSMIIKELKFYSFGTYAEQNDFSSFTNTTNIPPVGYAIKKSFLNRLYTIGSGISNTSTSLTGLTMYSDYRNLKPRINGYSTAPTNMEFTLIK